MPKYRFNKTTHHPGLPSHDCILLVKPRNRRYRLESSRQNGRRGTAPFGHPVVRWRRARGGPWLSGLRPDAVSRMRLRALGGGGGIARAGWRGVFPAQDSFCFTGRGSARWC